MIYLQLAYEFVKTGLFAIGGGLATLPFLREISINYPEWYNLNELSNMIAVGNATPGPIGVNMATYAGYATAGIAGGIFTTLALVLPSFIVILIVSSILDKFRSSIYVEGAFKGLRPAVIAMITVAMLQLAKEVFVTPNANNLLQSFSVKHIVLFVIIFALSKLQKKSNILLYIALGAIIGIIFKM